jgi:mannose/cellobiose epimerase-like protein (N-acyl-D-glucosamine 2-epimerase family)
MAWQRTRIADDGTVLTDGNARVKPGGESFLGQAKQVDVPHTVEALSLAAAHTGDPAWADLARRVVARYRDRR